VIFNINVCLTSLLLNTVSDEDTQARTDRVMLTPWVKFLWESYRNILELTKNNQTFEKLYADVAKEGRPIEYEKVVSVHCVWCSHDISTAFYILQHFIFVLNTKGGQSFASYVTL